VMMNVFNFEIDGSLTERVRSVCQAIRDKGVARGEMLGSLEMEDVYLSVYMVPLQYLNMLLKGYLPAISDSGMQKKLTGLVARGLLFKELFSEERFPEK
ncbi:MAG: hypothetical protein MI784_09785, partial [Cytophagales bacterium]|nr:hypothetical protein [Cytophagales bacterium]